MSPAQRAAIGERANSSTPRPVYAVGILVARTGIERVPFTASHSPIPEHTQAVID
jgi:hypothetical protein